MLKLKNDSIILDLTPAMVLAIICANEAYSEAGVDLVVTSARDGKHSRTSLHYTGNAVDLRTRNATPEQLDQIVNHLNDALNHHYDIVVEPTHLHLEFQPKHL